MSAPQPPSSNAPGIGRWTQTRRIAAWEFHRFVKWRQQLIGIAVMVVVGIVSSLVTTMVKNAKSATVRVAVVGDAALGFPLPPVDGVTWVAGRYPDAAAARAAVSDDSVAGALLVRDGAAATVVVRKRAAWTGRVESALTTARRAAQFAALPV
ncbi:MAG: hypothetical protein MUF40_06600, partial [Gemmatimonadaceae bacterium]|nr:hypothetical protein [Gemmatimonadaceae bacterium]